MYNIRIESFLVPRPSMTMHMQMKHHNLQIHMPRGQEVHGHHGGQQQVNGAAAKQYGSCSPKSQQAFSSCGLLWTTSRGAADYNLHYQYQHCSNLEAPVFRDATGSSNHAAARATPAAEAR